MTTFDELLKHRRDFDVAQFAELDDQPCSPTEDAILSIGTFLLALSPVLIVLGFWVL